MSLSFSFREIVELYHIFLHPNGKMEKFAHDCDYIRIRELLLKFIFYEPGIHLLRNESDFKTLFHVNTPFCIRYQIK